MLEKLRDEWEDFQEEEERIKAELEKKKTNLLNKIARKGYTFIDGEIVSNEKVYSIQYDFTYEDAYIPEKGQMEDSLTGTIEISNEAFQELKTAFESEPVQKDVIKKYIKDVLKAPSRFYEYGFEHSGFNVYDEDDEDELDDYLFEWYLHRGDISSGFNIMKRTRSEIAENPRVLKEGIIS